MRSRLRRLAARWLPRLALALGVGYPVALVAVTAAMRFIGEAWPVTAVALYLPRLGFAAPLPFVAGGLLLCKMRRLLWLQLASVVVLVFALMGLVLPWPHSPDAGAPKLRVLSYNVDSCRAGAERIVEEIDRYAPDVVALQELGETAETERLLRARYPTVDVSTQFLVASKYPMVSSSDPQKLSYDERLRSPRFVQRVLDTPLGRIAFYDVHPLSPRPAFNTLRGRGVRHELFSGRLFSSASGHLIEDNFGLRALQVRAFAEAAARETDPVILAGDTNLPELSRVLARNLSGYADGFTKAGWGFGYTYPSNDKHRPWMRIDRIMASEGLRFVGFEIGQSTASDHLCVVADVQRR
ncbi:MAG TPA: endonuclease/exonuclease/phosphatase family protein [Polyangiaceae bacterium]